ncbi:MAG: hypothetical protein ACKVQJ_12470 [Pyrinomonadaceae bacterium]
MKETGLEKGSSLPLKEKGQYVLAFGVTALFLYVLGFPVFILFFFGVLAFFIWKAFSFESGNEARRIFEFYLSAHEIISDEERRWYGFEIQEAVARGEAILRSMVAPPPLVHFGLGVLYQRLGDHSSAVRHLAIVVEDAASNEAAIMFPTRELKDYVRILRKIERTPSDAPLTLAAVGSLEKIRKSRGAEILEESRLKAAGQQAQLHESETIETPITPETSSTTYGLSGVTESKRLTFGADASVGDRKSISEVLHDIYDGNVQ